VPAVVVGLVRRVEDVELVAASTNGDPSRPHPPRGREVSLDLDRECLGDGVEHAGLGTVLAGVIDDRDRVHGRQS